VKIRDEISTLERRLRNVGSTDRAVNEKRYLKSDLDFLGVPTPVMRRLVKAWLDLHPELDRETLLRLVRELWKRRLHELRACGVLLLEARVRVLEPQDLELLEWMLRRSKTWAYVDAIAVHIAGPLVEGSPGLTRELDRWAVDDDFWIRRSAILALLKPLRRGEGDWTRFVRFADSMLEEREFFIRKAIGWVLREVAKKRPARVRRFVSARIDRVSGVTLREAVKYLPPEDREDLTTRYKSR
jgi:3-methyladenine DNA glycosylase AlkD